MKNKNTAQILARGVYQALNLAKPQNKNKVVDNFLLYLKKHRQENLIPEILLVLEAHHLTQQGITKISLFYQNQPNQQHLDDLVHILSKRLNKKIKMETKIDNNILGGIRLRYESKEIDLTLNRRLTDLFKQLIN